MALWSVAFSIPQRLTAVPLPLACKLTIRHVAGVRRLMGHFIRAVHPDLTANFPEEALRINQRSLAELNSYIDRLEAEGSPTLEDGPEVTRELPFFRAHQTRSGRVLPGRALPLRLPLPTLPVVPSELDREFAAVRLVRDAEVLLEKTSGGFSDQPQVPPLFTKKGAGRDAFDKLWWQQTREEMLRGALHGPDDVEVKRHAAARVLAQKYEYQLLRRYTRIRNNRRRREKLAAVSEKVAEMVKTRFGKPGPLAQGVVDNVEEDQQAKARVLDSGFHPDLVFVAPMLSEERRREAVRRVCGMNLTNDADFWLLENLWRAMRGRHPPVPLIIAESEYKAHVTAGFMQVPWDFTVAELCDLLEEHLEDVRAGLVRRRAQGGSRDDAPRPPPEPLALASPSGPLTGTSALDSEDWSDSEDSSESSSEDEDLDAHERPRLAQDSQSQ